MQKAISALFALCLLAWPASAQTIDALGSGGAVADATAFPAFQTANPAVKILGSQLKTYMETLPSLTISGTATGTLSSATGFSTGELLLTNNAGAGQNTLALYNSNVAGITALTLRGTDLREHLALGWNNPSSTYNGGGDFDFLEISDFDNGSNGAFTASIATNQLTVTGTCTGRALAAGQIISDTGGGNHIPIGTNITALGSGTGCAGTYTLNASIGTVASEAMTSGWPVPTFFLNRSGYVGGAYTTQQSLLIGNPIGGSPDALWSWKNITGGSLPSVFALQVDETNDFVNVPNSIVVGVQAYRAPAGSAMVDDYGQLIIGNNVSSRATTASTFLINTQQQTANQIRLVNVNNFKVDMLLNTSPLRMDFQDTDHSSVIPLSVAFDGSGKITAGGPIVMKGYTVGTLPAGTVGGTAYVTDQLTACAAIGAAPTGGGAVTCPVFYNGSAWVGG